MLETKGLCKVYQPKKGVPVTAVDHISLRFPEKGMVFLLGKSGSGKSTLLNLLGGLDKYDDGEIIIKGISSKDFNQQRFDSYRNTYVGFIFQEYNVLEEFTVGANIALALELQGKKATDEELNRILHDVDLDGYGSRKPNELSGGQKQRVAIARALVKNPEIIMADEPTGALDSATGRQVLDTLKKLSAEKLVIIVSHDREYAEQYADRIIELADGKVIRDVEWIPETAAANVQEQGLIFRASTIEIPQGYHLTEADRKQINDYIDGLKTGATITLPDQVRGFQDTDESRIPKQDGSKFSLIRSKLPMKNAFKIGCSSLKHKRVRLILTILLSIVAFGMFAIVDTFNSYDHIRACTDSLIDSNMNYVSVAKSKKYGSGIDAWWSSYNQRMTAEEIEQISKNTGVTMTGLCRPGNSKLSFDTQYNGTYEFSKGMFSTACDTFRSYAEVNEEMLKALNCKILAGKLPDGKKPEIAISRYIADMFMKAGYAEIKMDANGEMNYTDFSVKTVTNPDGSTYEESSPKYMEIKEPADMVGKTLMLNDTIYTITAVVDTGLDLERYEKLNESTEHDGTSDELVYFMLESELDYAVLYSLTGALMLGEGALDEIIAAQPKVGGFTDGWYEIYSGEVDSSCYLMQDSLTLLSLIPDSEIIWANGKKDSLAENEVIISIGCVQSNIENPWSDFDDDVPEMTPETLNEFLKQLPKLKGSLSLNDSDSIEEIKDIRIVGCIKPSSIYNGTVVLSDKRVLSICPSIYGIYDAAIGAMPDSRGKVKDFVEFCYPQDENITTRYELQNAVTYELNTVDEVLTVLVKVFFWVGLGFAFFAALLMANFISTSINYKRQEIGILRAIGSRSNDVFRIFFSESFVIAMINFVLSSVLCGVIIAVINYFLRNRAGILITVLHFGIRQIGLLFLISVAVAAIASFLPVRRIAAKRPIDAIRGK